MYIYIYISLYTRCLINTSTLSAYSQAHTSIVIVPKTTSRNQTTREQKPPVSAELHQENRNAKSDAVEQDMHREEDTIFTWLWIDMFPLLIAKNKEVDFGF